MSQLVVLVPRLLTSGYTWFFNLSKTSWLGLIISSTLAYAYSTSTLARRPRDS